MKLTDMIPKESKFYLKKANRSFILNPISLDDEIWLKNTYGESGVQEVFETVNIEEISRIVFKLMRNEDKEYFKIRDVEFVNEDGESETIKVGGINLLRQMTHGWGEKVALLNALLDNIGYSRPELKEDLKKKVTM